MLNSWYDSTRQGTTHMTSFYRRGNSHLGLQWFSDQASCPSIVLCCGYLHMDACILRIDFLIRHARPAPYAKGRIDSRSPFLQLLSQQGPMDQSAHLAKYPTKDKHCETNVTSLQKGDQRLQAYQKDEDLGYVLYGISYLAIQKSL